MLMHSEGLRTRPMDGNRIARFVSLTPCVSLLLCLLSCYQGTSGPSHAKTGEPAPPDLTNCTRVEIQYLPSLVENLFRSRQPADLLNPSELTHVQSLNPIVVKEERRIKALAQKINSGTHFSRGLPVRLPDAKVTGYRGTEEVVSFTILQGPYVVTRGDVFYYGDAGVSLLGIATDMGPLLLRLHCAAHLRGTALQWHSSLEREAVVRPAPETWCDATLAKCLRRVEEMKLTPPREQMSPERKQQYQEMERKWREQDEQYLVDVRNAFRCPAVRDGKCHYAMNPNCTAKSPPDTVFLFETKAGWNQHGGPELFTFDNHNPRGGLICLNNGTVKFIRTEEELKQLRWK
jgi:hypothetical protein